jgi:hypothetical protein
MKLITITNKHHIVSAQHGPRHEKVFVGSRGVPSSVAPVPANIVLPTSLFPPEELSASHSLEASATLPPV